MILLKSYGDRLVSGKYEFYSRSKHAANFMCQNALACCVDESVGPGPFSIVISGASVDSIESLCVERKKITINAESIPITTANRYYSRIEYLPNSNGDKFYDSLDYFGTLLKQLSCPLSLLFLIDPAKENQFKTDFEKEYVSRFKSGAELFLNSNYLEGVRRLRGLGFGLTPSGDDFLAGALAAVHLSQLALKTDKSNKLSQIYENARGDNPVVNAYLECAREGSYVKRFRDIIIGICRGRLLDLKKHTPGLLEAGKTSGVDWAVGFYLTLKSELRGG